MTWADSKRVERYTVGFMHNKNDRQTKGSEAKAKPGSYQVRFGPARGGR